MVVTMNQAPWRASTLHLVQAFAAKLVLEVFGAGGAIWGFSEAIGLRTADTIWFWRPAALCTGLLFLLRWMLQLADCVSMNENTWHQHVQFSDSPYKYKVPSTPMTEATEPCETDELRLAPSYSATASSP